tara:strand:+ start:8 stop:289 length:282 start_codon:yes stop_codon:yes gene_type:complete
MRTNALDSTAFRCLQEYKTLNDIYEKLFKRDFDYHVKEYLEELIECDTLKQIREKHEARVKFIKDKVDAYIEKQKKNDTVGGLHMNRIIHEDE